MADLFIYVLSTLKIKFSVVLWIRYLHMCLISIGKIYNAGFSVYSVSITFKVLCRIMKLNPYMQEKEIRKGQLYYFSFRFFFFFSFEMFLFSSFFSQIFILSFSTFLVNFRWKFNIGIYFSFLLSLTFFYYRKKGESNIKGNSNNFIIKRFSERNIKRMECK